MMDGDDDVHDEAMDEETDGDEPDETDVLPYYIVENQRYECPLGLRGQIRFVIDVAACQVIAAEVRYDDVSKWRQVERRGLDHLTNDVLYAELEELQCLLDEDADFDYADVSPFNFQNALPPWVRNVPGSTRR